MNSETNLTRYNFLETPVTSTPAAESAFDEEVEVDILAQAQEGYLFSGGVTDGDVLAVEYRFSEEAQTAFTNPNVPFELELFDTNDFAELEAEIAEQDTLGNDINSLSFTVDTNGENIWFAFFGPSTGPSFYTFSEDNEEFGDLLGSSFEADRTLTDIEYGDGTWIATFDESDVATGTSGSKSFATLAQDFQAKDAEGLELVDLEFGNGLWVARFSETPDDSTFTRSADYELFQEQIAAQEAEGLELVDVEYVADTWFGVFNEAEVTTSTTPDAPLPDITTRDPAPVINELPEFI